MWEKAFERTSCRWRRWAIGVALGGALPLLGGVGPSGACSEVFFHRGGETISARTMDLATEDWAMLLVSPRDMERESLPGPRGIPPLRWTARWSSVGIACFGSSVVADGMNERGLSAGALVLGETALPSLSGDRPGLNMGQWVQFFLDTCASVAEAVAAAEGVAPIPLVTEGQSWPLHIVLHDASGDSAVLEFLRGTLEVSRGPEVTVVTNDPPYRRHQQSRPRSPDLRRIPGDSTSPSRFLRGSALLEALPVPPSNAQARAMAWGVIQHLSMTPGAGIIPGTEIRPITLWTAVRDHRARRYFFRPTAHPQLHWVDVAETLLPMRFLPLYGELPPGDVSGALRPVPPDQPLAAPGLALSEDLPESGFFPRP